MPIEKQNLDDKTIQELWGPGSPNADEPGKEDPSKDKDKDLDKDKDKDKTKDLDKEKEAEAAQSRIEKLMEKHGFDEFDELVDALEESEEFAQKVGSRDLDQLIKDADYLETMRQWQADTATKQTIVKDDDSDDEDRVSRLEKTIQGLLDEKKAKEEAEKNSKESQRVIDGFNSLVTSTLKEQEIPEEHIEFVSEFLGVNHPTLDVDLDNKVAVRKAIKSGLKKYDNFVTMIINDYRDGKIKIPEITPTDTTSADEPKKVKNLEHARKITGELLGKMFR